MAPQCISRRWPLLGHQPEVSWAEPADEGHHDVGRLAHDGGSHSSGTVEGTAAPTPTWSVPSCWRAWLSRLRAPGEGLDLVAVVLNQPSVSMKLGGQVPPNCLSVGLARWSGLHRTVSVQDSSATLSPVPPDSSSALSPGRSVTLLLPVLLASASFCRGVGWGVGWIVEGKQVGSMNEESEVAIT